MNWETNTNVKKAGETRTICVDFTDKLGAEEVLSGTPTVTELRTSALTVSDVSVTVLDWTIGNRTVIAGNAVQFSVSGGTARNDYTLRVSTGSDTSPVQTLIYDYRLSVR